MISPNARKLVLKNLLSPGDIIMLSAAVRDLHRCYPSSFRTDVRTSYPQLWENNPYITELDEQDPGVETIECCYPLIHQSNQAPHHFIQGFIHFLNDRLGLEINVTEFKGDIHLSSEEKFGPSPLEALGRIEGPYWIISAGGKSDYTVKWWDTKRYQEVVDHFRGRITFVQVGAAGHYHPELERVIDLRGKTDLRQLIRLVYHADGIVCPVTLLMHLAAAVEEKPGFGLRPCVVIAGGREPPHWEAYPGHQFIHTVGMLPCCRTGGCWKYRTLPLDDRSQFDRPQHLCLDVAGSLPRCMDMITSGDVISRIEKYLRSKERYELARAEAQSMLQIDHRERISADKKQKLNAENARLVAEKFITQIRPLPEGFAGRGIVICAGGGLYFANAWVCINMLRRSGCQLPIQLWYLGKTEINGEMQDWVRPLDVECVDALEIDDKQRAKVLKGWPLKPYAVIHSRFKEVLLLDADNVPIIDPEFLFEVWQYKEKGAIFWPDFGRLGPERTIWKLCGVPYRDEPEFETGQLLVDKERCWQALALTMWYNEHSDFFYDHVHGDKETFHMAFRKLGQPYGMPPTPIHRLRGTMCQHDFQGRRVFQHRNMEKWSLHGTNARIEDFRFEEECLGFLEELRKRWPPDCGDAQAPHLPKPHARLDQQVGKPEEGPKRKRLVIKARFDGYTGYGLHAQEVVRYLHDASHDFGVDPIPGDQRLEVPVGPEVERMFTPGSQTSKWELILHPPNIEPRPRAATAYFTMWETTQLPENSVRNLRRAAAIITPCEWNASCFSAQGISVPIFICPLGIDPEVFRSQSMPDQNICVFGTGGNLSVSGRTRKGVETVILAFQRAFPEERDVVLRIKTLPGDEMTNLNDDRITLSTRCLTQTELAEWYAGLTCFVSASKCEAWGLMQLQAMAVGRPVIACRFAGLREFLSEHVGYCVDFTLERADERYAGLGVWAVPELDSLISQMRRVYENRKEAALLGEKASGIAHRLTWASSNSRLENILRQLGAL